MIRAKDLEDANSIYREGCAAVLKINKLRGLARKDCLIRFSLELPDGDRKTSIDISAGQGMWAVALMMGELVRRLQDTAARLERYGVAPPEEWRRVADDTERELSKPGG